MYDPENPVPMHVGAEQPDLLEALAASVAEARAGLMETTQPPAVAAYEPSGLDEFLPACPECGPGDWAMGVAVLHRAGCSRATAEAGDIPENPKPADVTSLDEFDRQYPHPSRPLATAQQLADAATAARRLDQVRRFITPAGEVHTISGPDATLARQQGLCADGAWTRDPETGKWYCAVCDRPAAAPVLAQIAALEDDEPGQLVEVDLPPLQPRARWEIDGTGKTPETGTGRGLPGEVIAVDDPIEPASPEPAKLEDAQVEGPPCATGGGCGCPPEAVRSCPGRDPDDYEADRLAATNGCPPAIEVPAVSAEAWDALVAASISGAELSSGPLCQSERDWARWETFLQHGPSWAPWATPAGPLGPIRITLPGIYDLTDVEYHDPAITGDWVSNSDLKAMTLPGAPSKWKYNRDHGIRKRSAEFDFGKASHRRVLGVGAEVVTRPAVNPANPDQAWPDWRTNAAKAWRAEQEAAGRVVVSAEDLQVIEDMAVALAEHPAARGFLAAPARHELAFFWTELLPSGRTVRRRAMLDSVPEYGPIVDFKTAESSAPDQSMQRTISRYRYHWQAAGYIAAVTHFDLPCEPDIVFLFQEKTAPYLVTPVNLDDPTMMAAEIEVRRALEVYAECVETGVWPGYTDGVVTMSIPEYELREFEEMEIK